MSVATRTFRSTPAAAGSSRHFLRDVLTTWQLDEFKDTAALAVSELMTNAVLHTAGAVQLTVRRLEERGIWVGVTDDSDRLPRLHQAADEDISGRGLSIVDLVSDAWGVTVNAAGGKTVWLRLSREGRTSQGDADHQVGHVPAPRPLAGHRADLSVDPRIDAQESA